MKCTNCGSEIAPNQAFCSTCGTPVPRQVNQFQGGAVNQNLGGQPGNFPPPPPRKGHGATIAVILITLLLIAGIIVGAVLIIMNMSEDDSSSSSSSKKKNNTLAENVINLVDDGNNVTNNDTNNVTNNTITVNPGGGNTSGYSVTAGGFTVKVPYEYVYEVQGNVIAISDENETMLINMSIAEKPYSSVIANKATLESNMRSYGATLNKSEEKTIDGVQCLVYETVIGGQNELFAYIRINSMYTACCEIVNADLTTYDYNVLKKAIPIVTSAVKSTSTTDSSSSSSSSSSTGNTTNIKSKADIDLQKIVE